MAALAALALAAAEPTAAQAPSDYTWTIGPSGRPAATDTRQITIRYRRPDGKRTSTGSARALGELQGLDQALLASAEGGPGSFRIASDPGTLQCTGVVGQGTGTGTCAYSANAGFADALAREGFARPTAEEQFQMLVHGADLTLARDFRALGYTGLTPEQLISFRIFYVTPDDVRELRRLGYTGMSVDQLVARRIFGVPMAYARALGGLGYTGLSIGQLVDLRRAGVTPEFIQQANQGGRRLSPGELLHLRGRR
jgi:hypothetical protein